MAQSKISAFNHLRMVALRCAASSTEKIAELAGAVSDALEEMAGQKADKATFKAISIPVSAWKANSDTTTKAAGFAFYADVSVEGLTAADSAGTDLDISSLKPAYTCGMAQTATPMAGKIRYYAVTKPTTALTAQLRIIQGAEQ